MKEIIERTIGKLFKFKSNVKKDVVYLTNIEVQLILVILNHSIIAFNSLATNLSFIGSKSSLSPDRTWHLPL